MQTETCPAYAVGYTVAHSAPPNPDHLEGETTMGANTNPHLPWEQWWPATASAFPLSFEGHDTLPHDDIQYNDFSPNSAIEYSPNWPGFSNTQEYPVPSSILESSYLEQSSYTEQSPHTEQSPNIPESRGGSASALPDRKRKRSISKRTTAYPLGRGSNRQNRSQATGEERPQDSQSRKVQHTKPNSSPSPEKELEGGCNRRIQERNRVASNKLRVKKREDMIKLKADEEDMERINCDLWSCVADLTLEIYNLKIRLLQHTDCDCSLIQNYIVGEAHRYIQDLEGEHQGCHGCR